MLVNHVEDGTLVKKKEDKKTPQISLNSHVNKSKETVDYIFYENKIVEYFCKSSEFFFRFSADENPIYNINW